MVVEEPEKPRLCQLPCQRVDLVFDVFTVRLPEVEPRSASRDERDDLLAKERRIALDPVGEYMIGIVPVRVVCDHDVGARVYFLDPLERGLRDERAAQMQNQVGAQVWRDF